MRSLGFHSFHSFRPLLDSFSCFDLNFQTRFGDQPSAPVDFAGAHPARELELDSQFPGRFRRQLSRTLPNHRAHQAAVTLGELIQHAIDTALAILYLLRERLIESPIHAAIVEDAEGRFAL